MALTDTASSAVVKSKPEYGISTGLAWFVLAVAVLATIFVAYRINLQVYGFATGLDSTAPELNPNQLPNRTFCRAPNSPMFSPPPMSRSGA